MSAATTPTVLVMAKAPVPGEAKTRLAATVGAAAGAHLAAAAVLDTLDAANATGWPVVVALAGDLGRAALGDEIAEALRPHRVVEQRGRTFADRLVAAHEDACTGGGVVQIGMDTPQVDGGLLVRAGETLESRSAALGLARDGGWWVLAVRSASTAGCLTGVPMSRPDTGRLTREALLATGASVATLPVLTDVDEWADAEEVATAAPQTRFARALAQIEMGVDA